MQSLLREKESTIAALRDIPPELYPQLFLEAYGCKHKDIMKAMVPQWPFHCLPMGCFLEHTMSHESYNVLQDILDGIDILLYEKIRPR